MHRLALLPRLLLLHGARVGLKGLVRGSGGVSLPLLPRCWA